MQANLIYIALFFHVICLRSDLRTILMASKVHPSKIILVGKPFWSLLLNFCGVHIFLCVKIHNDKMNVTLSFSS